MTTANQQQLVARDLFLEGGRGRKKGASILVVDNTPEVQRTLQMSLRSKDYTIISASTGYEALIRFDEYHPDLVLLNVDLPGIPCWEVCQHFLGKARVPIVFLATKYRENDAVHALQLGAVDYVMKTVPPQILLARTQAALRRNESVLVTRSPTVYTDRYLHIDSVAQEVLVEGSPVQLTTMEYDLLIYLLKKANQVCSKDQILKHIWGTGYESCLHYVRLYIGRLRRKIERFPKEPDYLISVYREGYYFRLNSLPAE